MISEKLCAFEVGIGIEYVLNLILKALLFNTYLMGKAEYEY